jgi:prepilin-type N-terminal cleavage/methylation domain-containing protein
MMKSEKGFSLAEVMVAMVLMGIVAVAFLSAIGTASKAVLLADEQASAESLARSEMEYVKGQEYSVASPVSWSYELPSDTSPTGEFPSWWDEYPSSLPDGYEIYVVTVSGEPYYDTDNGIQKITVIVERDGKQLVILESYRSIRL